MKLYFVAGESSGDNHGAELLRALRARHSEVRFFGRGGPKMRALGGAEFRDWIDEAAVVGLWEVLKRYGFFRREFDRALTEVAALKPDAVVLIDYPGFNLRLARALRRKNPALKIIYYISPQVWAWKQGRVRSMARSVDLMLCIFPFEPPLYEPACVRALFVGHPMTSVIPTLASESSDAQATRDLDLIALFPGSRQREVTKILPIMLASANQILRRRPEIRFEVAAASDSLAAAIRRAIKKDATKFSVSVGQAHELMMRAGVAIIASGTATLEAALSRLPFVLVYRVAWVTYFAARLVVKVNWLGMPNVLANREIVPEFIQHRARPRQIAGALIRLLDDESARAKMLTEFDAVRAKLKTGEPAANAADAILCELRTASRHWLSQATTPAHAAAVK
jgi:lipid-A-disaccharide synthase